MSKTKISIEEFNNILLAAVNDPKTNPAKLDIIFSTYDVAEPSLKTVEKDLTTSKSDSTEKTTKAIEKALENPHIVNKITSYHGYGDEIGGEALLKTILQNKTDLAKSLLDHGISPTATTTKFDNPLSAAIYHSRNDIADLILARGEDIAKLSSISSTTPYNNYVVYAFSNKDPEQIKYFSKKNQTNSIDFNEIKDGKTIADLALEKCKYTTKESQEQVKKLLSDHGALTAAEVQERATSVEKVGSARVTSKEMIQVRGPQGTVESLSHSIGDNFPTPTTPTTSTTPTTKGHSIGGGS